MVDGDDVKRKGGAVTVLALLVTFLLGYAPAAAQTTTDGNGARLGTAELVKRGAALRTSVRSGQPDDQDFDSAIVPPSPDTITEILDIRAAGVEACIERAAAPRRCPSAYRARAPPTA